MVSLDTVPELLSRRYNRPRATTLDSNDLQKQSLSVEQMSSLVSSRPSERVAKELAARLNRNAKLKVLERRMENEKNAAVSLERIIRALVFTGIY